jgi:hypothetical protein
LKNGFPTNQTDDEFTKNRDDSPYVSAALNGLDFADFGQLSPAEQSLVLMRAAQIQQTQQMFNFA